jgi:uncharacterized protein
VHLYFPLSSKMTVSLHNQTQNRPSSYVFLLVLVVFLSVCPTQTCCNQDDASRQDISGPHITSGRDTDQGWRTDTKDSATTYIDVKVASSPVILDIDGASYAIPFITTERVIVADEVNVAKEKTTISVISSNQLPNERRGKEKAPKSTEISFSPSFSPTATNSTMNNTTTTTAVTETASIAPTVQPCTEVPGKKPKKKTKDSTEASASPSPAPTKATTSKGTTTATPSITSGGMDAGGMKAAKRTSMPTFIPTVPSKNESSPIKPENKTDNTQSQSPTKSTPTTQAPNMSTTSTNEVTTLPSNSTTGNTTNSTPTYNASYAPGNLVVAQHGLLLSQGLSARILAEFGKPVVYGNGSLSEEAFHTRPDFGATFVDYREHNPGGYIYVSNSESIGRDLGGVGALTFDRNGSIIDYRMVLNTTKTNCGGGRTPWGAWISCEERGRGKIWQVDPTGERKAAPITLGNEGGKYESFSYDIRNKTNPKFFATEDRYQGPLRMFEPYFTNWSDPWNILYGPGKTSYLMIHRDGGKDEGTFSWIGTKEDAYNNSYANYCGSEGIDVMGNELYFVGKYYKTLFILDLDTGTYKNYTTVRGLFNSQPDQVVRILGDRDELLYFTEDGKGSAGIHARNTAGEFYTILESVDYPGEATGLSFSPDVMKM